MRLWVTPFGRRPALAGLLSAAPGGPRPVHLLRPAALRVGLYSLILVVIASWAVFTRLGQGMLLGDEASFAYTTDRMVLTGDWVVPFIHDGAPHLNAAPLYNWLCCLTFEWATDGNLRYRIWSALFAVGCVLTTLALGTLLFRAEVGFCAGLFLITNESFVFLHAARWGVMETALVFFISGMVLGYLRTFQTDGRARWWWALIGVCLGLAVLTKPPALGGFLFLAMSFHHLVQRTDRPWKDRMLGPIVAASVAGLIAAPWYILLAARVGPAAIDTLFVTNSIRRAANGGHARITPASYYVEAIWQTSMAFKFAAVALAWGGGCAVMGWRRREWSLLLVLMVPFLAALSTASTKYLHYAYAVFPFLSIVAAACLLDIIRVGTTKLKTRFARYVVVALVLAIALVLVRRDLGIVARQLKAPVPEYFPQRLYETLEDDVRSGRVRIVLYEFPRSTESNLEVKERGFVAHDRYYRPTLRLAVDVWSAAELNQLLADGKPTVLLLAPRTSFGRIRELGVLPADRSRLGRANLDWYPVVTFHNADAILERNAAFREIELKSANPPHP